MPIMKLKKEVVLTTSARIERSIKILLDTSLKMVKGSTVSVKRDDASTIELTRADIHANIKARVAELAKIAASAKAKTVRPPKEGAVSLDVISENGANHFMTLLGYDQRKDADLFSRIVSTNKILFKEGDTVEKQRLTYMAPAFIDFIKAIDYEWSPKMFGKSKIPRGGVFAALAESSNGIMLNYMPTILISLYKSIQGTNEVEKGSALDILLDCPVNWWDPKAKSQGTVREFLIHSEDAKSKERKATLAEAKRTLAETSEDDAEEYAKATAAVAKATRIVEKDAESNMRKGFLRQEGVVTIASKFALSASSGTALGLQPEMTEESQTEAWALSAALRTATNMVKADRIINKKEEGITKIPKRRLETIEGTPF